MKATWLRLLLLLCVSSSVQTQGFYLLDRNKQYTNNGLLIADKINGFTIGTVCDDEFGGNEASVICTTMKYNTSLSFDSAFNFRRTWDYLSDFEIVLDDLSCDSPNITLDSCSYVQDDDCKSNFEEVFLECGCSDNHYIRPGYRGCAPCPSGATLSPTSNLTCVCGSGKYWRNETCEDCPVDTYKLKADESDCKACPEHSTSLPGSQVCTCAAGYYWRNEVCVVCPDGMAKSAGSDVCVGCPVGSEVIQGRTACSCEAGLHWNTTHCVTCPSNSYSTENSTTCALCPDGTVADPGSSHCVTCPSNTFWQNYTCTSCDDGDHVTCPSCPAGYTMRGKMCIEDKEPQEHVAAPKNWSTIILAVVMAALLILSIILALMLYRRRQRRMPPKSAAPLVPYHMVRDLDTPSSGEPVYEAPIRGGNQPPIYEDLHLTPQYVEPEPQYVVSDHGEETEYVQADSVTGYSAYCGGQQQTEPARQEFNNLYDNI